MNDTKAKRFVPHSPLTQFGDNYQPKQRGRKGKRQKVETTRQELLQDYNICPVRLLVLHYLSTQRLIAEARDFKQRARAVDAEGRAVERIAKHSLAQLKTEDQSIKVDQTIDINWSITDAEGRKFAVDPMSLLYPATTSSDDEIIEATELQDDDDD